MDTLNWIGAGVVENWHVWFVAIVLIVAAVIDGIELRVPNWITFPLIISGWIYSASAAWMAGDGILIGLYWSFIGTVVGLALLLPAYMIGGMGAGDVKLLAGVGAWLHGEHTFYAFCLTAVVGAVLAVGMAVRNKAFKKHSAQAKLILNEILTIRDPRQLSEIAAERKSSMLLLPYGIPIAIGSIAYFAWCGLLL